MKCCIRRGSGGTPSRGSVGTLIGRTQPAGCGLPTCANTRGLGSTNARLLCSTYPIIAATDAANCWFRSAYTCVTSARECPSITWAASHPVLLPHTGGERVAQLVRVPVVCLLPRLDLGALG